MEIGILIFLFIHIVIHFVKIKNLNSHYKQQNKNLFKDYSERGYWWRETLWAVNNWKSFKRCLYSEFCKSN